MKIDILDPLLDPRWDDLVARHPRACVFHTKGWLQTLARTYGYRPVALTSAAANESLSDGLVYCEVKSSITGERLVSLPFSDHADPLIDRWGDSLQLQEWIRAARSNRNWKYVELRPISWPASSGSSLVASENFRLHTLDLTPSLEVIFRNLHKSCMQRRIRHAERQSLAYERSSSLDLLDDFYKLFIATRKRHEMLPQPRSWFRNLMVEMSPHAEIRMVRKDGAPIAAILTLRHRGTVVYKYGCSDESQHHLAGVPFLFWRLIEESKAEGAEQMDLGRTEFENTGLTEFKDRLGTTRSKITYLRYPKTERKSGIQLSRLGTERKLFSFLPEPVSTAIGQVLYRHMA